MGYNAAEGANPGRRRAAGRPGGGRGQLARDAAGLRARRHATKVIYIAVGNGEKYGGVERRQLSIMRQKAPAKTRGCREDRLRPIC